MEMLKGRVVWWSNAGYGFVKLNDEESIFAHLKRSDRHQIIKENTLIEFTIEKTNCSNILHLHNPQEN